MTAVVYDRLVTTLTRLARAKTKLVNRTALAPRQIELKFIRQISASLGNTILR